MDFQQIARAWREAALATEAVSALWFETDHRQELLQPRAPFAFHISVSDDLFEPFVAERQKFIEVAGPIATESLEDVPWLYPPTWRASRNIADDTFRLLTCWIVFADGTQVDLVVEKQSESAGVPRAFWKPVCDKSLGIQGMFMRRRIGKGQRVIRKRPRRAGS